LYNYPCGMATDDLHQRQASVDTLAAMAHPMRQRLVDLLSSGGPATVGKLAEQTGGRVGSISHHLKVLAGTGLIEEAPELARDRRESWWRVVKGSWRWSIGDFGGDPAGEVIARAAEEQQLAASFAKARAWYDSRDDYDPAWIAASVVSTSWLKATPEELSELGHRMQQLIEEFVEGQQPDADDGRESVYLFMYGMPVKA
jgi:DNA-binding transcriptional ArsR family regulator